MNHSYVIRTICRGWDAYHELYVVNDYDGDLYEDYVKLIQRDNWSGIDDLAQFIENLGIPFDEDDDYNVIESGKIFLAGSNEQT